MSIKPAIQAPATTEQLVTITQYIASRSTALRDNPEMEGKRFYQIVVSLVLDNPFSHAAKLSFPEVRHDFGTCNITVWAWKLRSVWLPNLSRADRNRFYNLKFIP